MLSLLLCFFTLLATTHAWGIDIHNQIAFAAEEFLSPFTQDVLSRILDPRYKGSIGAAASWADGYAHTVNGSHTYKWHWIDSNDHPPNTCHISPTDCPPTTGCITSAISTQTAQLQLCISLALTDPFFETNTHCSHALNYILHFLPDIHQPLHTSGRYAGGNFFRVSFAGRKVSLHKLWDSILVHHVANVTSSFPTQAISPYFSHLVARVRGADDFVEPVAEWLRCVDPGDDAGRCAMEWARESNALTCAYVYRGVGFGEGVDLLESGYVGDVAGVVEMQVVKAAVRLAAWLEGVVEGVGGGGWVDGQYYGRED